MKKFQVMKHSDHSTKWITADNMRLAKERVERFAGLLNQTRFDWAWETVEVRYVYQLHVIRNHQIVRSYTLRPDWR